MNQEKIEFIMGGLVARENVMLNIVKYLKKYGCVDNFPRKTYCNLLFKVLEDYTTLFHELDEVPDNEVVDCKF